MFLKLTGVAKTVDRERKHPITKKSHGSVCDS